MATLAPIIMSARPFTAAVAVAMNWEAPAQQAALPTGNLIAASMEMQVQNLRHPEGVPKFQKVLTSDFETQERDLASLELAFRMTAQGSSRDILGSLELALTQVYKLAVFIRGDYDARAAAGVQLNEFNKMIVFANCIQAFFKCQSISERGLKQLGDVHAKVSCDCRRLCLKFLAILFNT